MESSTTHDSGPQYHPALFNTAMIRAIKAGKKTQTRRVMLPQPVQVEDWGSRTKFWEWKDCQWADRGLGFPLSGIEDHSPYGLPGDRLWVRETWACLNSKIRPGSCIVYRADIANGERVRCDAPWKPSIHMPRWASRITLEITEVRVQRLQEISEADCRAEGAEYLRWFCPHGRGEDASVCLTSETIGPMCDESHSKDNFSPSYRNGFATLWDSINGKGGYIWDANPWVWATTFRVL